MLEVEQLSVGVRGRALVDRVSLTVGEGETLAIVGPNGAGKTTLLEAIAGLRPEAMGSVRSRGSFAYAPDDARLPEELDVDEILAASGASAAACIRERERFGLDALRARRGDELSRGEAKRVWLAATALLERPIALLDEPFGAFDPLQLDDVLAAVRATFGRRAVIATVHQLETAERIADRVLILAAGRAVAHGTLAELRERVGQPEASLDAIFRAVLADAAA